MKLRYHIRCWWRRLYWAINPPLPYVAPPKEKIVLLGGPADGVVAEIEIGLVRYAVPVASKMKAVWMDPEVSLTELLQHPHFGLAMYCRTKEVLDGKPVFRFENEPAAS